MEWGVETKQLLPPSPYVDDIDRFDRGNFSKPSIKIVAMGSLELDDPDCLEELKGLVESLEWNDPGNDQDYDEGQDGSFLVLFGNFKTDTMRLSSALEEIAKIIKAAKVSRKHSILIVPGPQDAAPNACWPLPAFHKHNTPLSLRELDNVYMCTNPCRIEFRDGRSVVLLRKDLIRESLQNQILSVSRDDETTTAPPPPLDKRVLHHMLSQGHIMPASTSITLHPIYWNFDHAMRLTPLPDLMIVGMDADYAEEGLEYVRSGCRVLAPPSQEQQGQNWLQVIMSGDGTMHVEMGQVNGDNED